MRWTIAGHAGTMPVLTPARVVDTTGAGDAFTAGLLHQLVALSAQADLSRDCDSALVETMVRYAAACGALVCVGAGGIDPQPDPDAVADFLNQA